MNSTHTSSRIVTKRPANERGQANHGWLQARFTFSFSEYFDPDQMGFQSLRVMNNDTIQPDGGFPTHPHSDMEIFTYVIEGQLAHKDSMGNGSTIEAGDLQYMSAGSGVRHSEYNPSSENLTHLYQVWLQPNENGGEPRYAEKRLGNTSASNALTLLFSGAGRGGSTAIRQDAEIYFGRLEAAKTLEIPADTERPHLWLQVISGQVSIAGETLDTADGLAIENAPSALTVDAAVDTKFLLFRLS
ncbi:MAG: pirin family protein [Opitutaceae bacterium]|jgi:quercetin 2,3-dioxygenase|nr:pirin family protein [Opitutaceae bacterium]